MNNILIQADNLIGLKYLLNECKLRNKVDLIYIDPPYATGAKFVCTEQRSATISRRREGILAYSDELSGEAYLDFIRERLLLAHEALSERGSIYVHHDFKVGSYVNSLLGEIFGEENYRNNIVRKNALRRIFRASATGILPTRFFFIQSRLIPFGTNLNWIIPTKKSLDFTLKPIRTGVPIRPCLCTRPEKLKTASQACRLKESCLPKGAIGAPI